MLSFEDTLSKVVDATGALLGKATEETSRKLQDP
jgi:hypothetical protein